MKNQNLIIGILVIALVLVLAFFAFQGNITSSEDKIITASGDATITTMPDKAEVYVRITTNNTDANLAKTANQDINNKVIAALKKLGLSDSDIETTSYDLRKNQVWEDNSYVDKGYIAETTLKVSTKDLSKAGSIIDASVSAGAQGIDYVSFTLSNERQAQVKKDALANATVAARTKAETIASSLGVKLAGIKSVSEPNVGQIYYNAYPNFAMAEGASVKAADFGTQLQPKSLEISAQISVVYKIR